MLKSCRRVEVVKKRPGRAKKKMLRNRRWHYGGPQLSRQKKKPRGKRKRLTAKGRTLRQKGKDSRQKKKHHSKRKNLTAKRKDSRQKKKNLLALTLSFMPWGHCYFCRCEVISFAVSLVLILDNGICCKLLYVGCICLQEGIIEQRMSHYTLGWVAGCACVLWSYWERHNHCSSYVSFSFCGFTSVLVFALFLAKSYSLVVAATSLRNWRP